MKLIEQAWLSYLEQVIPADAPEIQREECRRSFYAGAKSLFDVLEAIGGDEVSEDQGERVLQSVSSELAAFPLSLITEFKNTIPT